MAVHENKGNKRLGRSIVITPSLHLCLATLFCFETVAIIYTKEQNFALGQRCRDGVIMIINLQLPSSSFQRNDYSTCFTNFYNIHTAEYIPRVPFCLYSNKVQFTQLHLQEFCLQLGK